MDFGAQQAMARELDEASACAVCIDAKTPRGWFQEQIERALDLQTHDASFRVIPVLLPDANPDYIPEFLSLRTWVDFCNEQDHDYAYHVLKQGIKGKPIGRWSPKANDQPDGAFAKYEQKVLELRKFRELGVHEEVVIKFERKILDRWLDEGVAE